MKVWDNVAQEWSNTATKEVTISPEAETKDDSESELELEDEPDADFVAHFFLRFDHFSSVTSVSYLDHFSSAHLLLTDT